MLQKFKFYQIGETLCTGTESKPSSHRETAWDWHWQEDFGVPLIKDYDFQIVHKKSHSGQQDTVILIPPEGWHKNDSLPYHKERPAV